MGLARIIFSLYLLQVVICFTVAGIRCNRRRVSVDRKTSRAFFSHVFCTHDHVLTPHYGSSRVRSRVIHMSSMFAHERSSSFSCCHSSPLTLPSCPWPPPRLWLLSRHCRIRRPLTRSHETRSMALWPYPHLLQVMSPMRPTIPTTWKSVLRSSRAQASRPSTTVATTARSAHTLRLTTSTSGMRWLHHCTSRREANASLRQTYHSNEESLFPSAQSILASTVRPAQKRMSSQS